MLRQNRGRHDSALLMRRYSAVSQPLSQAGQEDLAVRTRSVQRGQVVVLSMVLVGIALVAFSRYFHTAQVVAARARQTHSLDTASYSGALIQARALNLLAYSNRAQIGHHVAMAHLVTLASWAHMAGTEAQQLARGNPPPHLIAMLFGSDHGNAYLAAAQASGFRGMAQASGDLGTAYAAHDRTVQQVLGVAQERIVTSLPDARRTAMLTVLNQNFGLSGDDAPDGAEDYELVIHDDQWPGFVKRYSGQTLRPFVLQTAELYHFLAPRNHTARNSWVVDARCPSRRHELRRRGTTQLDAAGRWQSIDTQSFHALRSNRWIGCYFREYAMGWGWIPGAATHTLEGPYVSDPPENFSSQDFWRWVRESTDWNISSGSANALANSKANLQRQPWQGGGFRSFFDVHNSGINRVGFSATLKRHGPEDTVITSHSAAESFFERPEHRRDGRQEYANLFRPYWQARLSERIIPTLLPKVMP